MRRSSGACSQVCREQGQARRQQHLTASHKATERSKHARYQLKRYSAHHAQENQLSTTIATFRNSVEGVADNILLAGERPCRINEQVRDGHIYTIHSVSESVYQRVTNITLKYLVAYQKPADSTRQ